MKRKAFTLIELLVVLGIIVFLLSIIIPAFGLARKYSQSMRCLSNIKQITFRMINYDMQNERFPYSFYYKDNMKEPDGGFLGDLAFDYLGWYWINYIRNEENQDVRKDTIFWCPSRRMQRYKYNLLVANYGVNQSICKSWSSNENTEFSGHPLTVTDIRYPSQSVLVLDSGYSMINWYHVTDSPPVPLEGKIKDRSYLPGLEINKSRDLAFEQKEDAIGGRHLNKSVNIGFADGHGERRKAEDLFVEKTAEGYKKLSTWWKPEKTK